MKPDSWLLLRGLAREQRHWGAFLPALRAAMPGARVHCLDLPGAGTEHARESPATIRGIAEDVRQRWLALGPGRWGLFAMSLGGMVAMEWCAAHPADFSALVIANTSGRGLNPFWQRMRPAIVPQIALALASRDAEAREKRILSLTTRLHDGNGTAAQWAAFHTDRPMSRSNALRQLLAASRFQAPARIDVPMLVISSAKDGFTHPACPKALAARFNAPLAVHPEAGHDIANDAPDWLAAEIRGHLIRFSSDPTKI